MVEKIGVIGLGYVGLPLACALASKGFKVVGLDTDLEKLKMIENGVTPIYEEGLGELLQSALKHNKLTLTSDYDELVRACDACFICVGTPPNPDGSANLKHVEETAIMVADSLRHEAKYFLIVVRSTIPPGTTLNLVKKIIEERSGRRMGEYGLCFNPEFLREGKALQDILNPDRIVIGAVDERSEKTLLEIYKKFHGELMPPVLLTTPTNAELIKYASNVFLAMKISFINMISQICQHLPDADVKVVAEGMGMDKRIGKEFLNAGLGWGGSCFPKDVKAFLRFGETLGVKMKLVEAVIEINELQIENALRLAENLLGGFNGKTVSVLGLAFKPGTDDVRESRSIKLVEKLIERGVRVKVHDPRALENARKVLGNKVEYCSSIEECLHGSDLCILATEWPEDKDLDPSTLQKFMKSPALLDCRRIYDSKKFREIKFAAIGLGLRSVHNNKL